MRHPDRPGLELSLNLQRSFLLARDGLSPLVTHPFTLSNTQSFHLSDK
jgi:hypothetical protein